MLLEFVLLALTALASAPATDDDCGEQVCLYGLDRSDNALAGEEAGSWKPDARLSRKRRRKEAKKNRKRKNVSLSVALEGSRGSVFVDGRYLATSGPHAQRGIKPGRHEIELRDGDRVIAVGVLTIPRKLGALALVVHADR
jgi:hypothetical protein